MKSRILFIFLIGMLFTHFSFSQNTPIPSGSFTTASDVNDWTISPNTVSKSWFNGGCQSMFVDNLPNNQTATITSPLFSIGLSGDYELELEYGVIYSGTAAVFELIDSNNNVLSASTNNTVTGTCTDWPNPKKSSLVFSNLSSGDYQLRITIPKSQFFLDGVSLGLSNPITVSGSVVECSNNNLINNFPIKITDLSDNSSSYTTIINGNYTFNLPNTSGNFLIELVNNGTIVSTPNSSNLNITASSNTYLNNDFCLTSNVSGIDVETQLVSLNSARPGFTTNYNLTFSNNGDTTTGSESIVLNFDGYKMNYQSASITPTSTTSNSITWNYNSLTTLESRNINLSFNILTTPTTVSGDILSFTGNITPVTDVNPVNNYTNLDQLVVNAYDPNDVLCIEGNQISPTQIGDDLMYRIRFQNTGTASAVNISIKTDLDADLDWTTFQPVSASHTYTTFVANGNELTFRFNNINLDDSTTNEPGSHGWIFYKVKPKSTAVVGDTFDATANIYFDFNQAVVTNTYTTSITNTLAVNNYKPQEELIIFPNPTNGLLLMNLNYLGNYSLFNINGQLLQKGSFNIGENNLDISNLPNGLYLMKTTTLEGKTFTNKVYKK